MDALFQALMTGVSRDVATAVSDPRGQLGSFGVFVSTDNLCSPVLALHPVCHASTDTMHSQCAVCRRHVSRLSLQLSWGTNAHSSGRTIKL